MSFPVIPDKNMQNTTLFNLAKRVYLVFRLLHETNN